MIHQSVRIRVRPGTLRLRQAAAVVLIVGLHLLPRRWRERVVARIGGRVIRWVTRGAKVEVQLNVPRGVM